MHPTTTRKNAPVVELLFGEVLPAGVTKLLDEVHLDARQGCHSGDGADEEGGVSVVDMGSGVGKLCLQLLLQYECVTRIEGIELAISRYRLGKQALMELVEDGWGEATPGDSAEGEQRRQPHVPYHIVHSSPTSTTIALILVAVFLFLVVVLFALTLLLFVAHLLLLCGLLVAFGLFGVFLFFFTPARPNLPPRRL